MKKNLSIFAAALILTVSLASCGKDSLDNEEIKKPEPPSTMTTTVTTTTTTTTTTKATTKKTTKAITTTAQTTTTTKTSNTDTASPVGKWKISSDEGNEMAEYFEDASDDLDLSSFTFEFNDNDKCTMQVESDVSSMMSLTDEGFNFYGIIYKDLKYDGSVLTLNADSEIVEFKRIGTPDINSKYGQYTCDALEGEEIKDEDFDKSEYIFDFRSSGKAYMIASFTFKYNYDAEKKTISFMGQDDIDVEFDGNKMILKTSEDSKSIFERAD
ncbi:MAG: hypothetical protein K6G82_07210 [Ruminococcus sp.]|nr:hypothetical protein [Ruminococcus sp.]